MQRWVRQNAAKDPLQGSLERLSSGLRINSAADDASGLAISTKMQAQVRGLNRASQNITDGISWVQTAEGALVEVEAMLQRGRELAVQAANDTLTADDRRNIQLEIDQLLAEVDKIGSSTEYNGKKVFATTLAFTDDQKEILKNLKRGWLAQGEKLVKDLFGLEGDNSTLKIVFVNDPAPGAFNAAVAGYIINGKTESMELRINVAQWTGTSWPDGDIGIGPANYQDRVIAHEMVHAIMGRNMDMSALPNWFKEGAAEFIHGADERLAIDMGIHGVGNVVAQVADGTWTSNSLHYSGAFAAVRYLHDAAAGGIAAILGDIAGGATLDQAISNRTSFTDQADFLSSFGANGVAFIGTMNLGNADTGAVGGQDADGGAPKTAGSVVPDVDAYTEDPLLKFVEIYPTEAGSGSDDSGPVRLQVGANDGDTMDITLSTITTGVLGLTGADVTQDPAAAISSFDTAIATVSSERSRMGAVQNRLQHALSVNQLNAENTAASQSRIQDADIAQEVVAMARHRILNEAGISLMAQVGSSSKGRFQALLRGIA